MTISATIAYNVAVVVVWLTLLCCCGLGCNDSSSGNNINAGNNTYCLALYYRGSKPCNECLAVLLLFLRSMIVCRTICQIELETIP
jgi:hypothetical protein